MQTIMITKNSKNKGNMMQKIFKTSITKGYTYQEYLNLINVLAAEKKSTGTDQSQERIAHTKLNASRIRRLDKTIVIPEEAIRAFRNMGGKTWLVLLESWCSDGAQTIPILNKIIKEVLSIDLKIVLRDENIELMDMFLTKGTRSIPKIIILDGNNEVIGSWGPRSKFATDLVTSYQKQNGKIDERFKKELQLWYIKDKGKEIINDLKELSHDLCKENSITNRPVI